MSSALLLAPWCDLIDPAAVPMPRRAPDEPGRASADYARRLAKFDNVWKDPKYRHARNNMIAQLLRATITAADPKPEQFAMT